MLPSAYTPSDLITKEVFIKGTEPTEVSPRFAQFDNVTNIRYDYSISSGKIRLNWDYQEPKILTDAYLNNYFHNQYLEIVQVCLLVKENYIMIVF